MEKITRHLYLTMESLEWPMLLIWCKKEGKKFHTSFVMEGRWDRGEKKFQRGKKVLCKGGGGGEVGKKALSVCV